MATCPKCREFFSPEVPPTRHHILPVRWFGKKNNQEKLKLCRPCHDLVEIAISQEEKGRQLRWTRYYEIVNEFLGYKLLEV